MHELVSTGENLTLLHMLSLISAFVIHFLETIIAALDCSAFGKWGVVFEDFLSVKIKIGIFENIGFNLESVKHVIFYFKPLFII